MKKPSAIDNYNQSLSWHQEINIKTWAKTKKHEEEEEEEEEEANKCKDINTNN